MSEKSPQNQPDLDPSIFEKDDNAPLGYTIKRPKSDKVKHKVDFLKDGANFAIINGATGSGKTTALLAFLVCFTDEVKYIILASAKYDDDVHGVIGDYCEKKGIEYIYVHQTDETNEAIAKVLDEKDEKEHMLCIFDDFNINYTSKGKDPYNEILIKVFALLRSAGCSGILLTQSYSNVPTKVRENVNIRICFELGNVFSYRAFVDDVVGMFCHMDEENKVRQDIKTLFSQVYSKPHAFVIVAKDPQPHIRLGWKEIVYPENQKPKPEQEQEQEQERAPLNPHSKGFKEKQAMWKEAKKMGIEEWRFQYITNKDLKLFLEKKGKHELPVVDNKDTYRQRLVSRVKHWKSTLNPRLIQGIADLLEKCVVNGKMTMAEAKFFIDKNDLKDEIELPQK